MVQKIEEYTVCNWDLPDNEVRVRGERAPVLFSVGTTRYRIDECEPHAGDAMKLLTQLTAIADRLDGKTPSRASRAPVAGTAARRPRTRRAQTAEVRAWVRKRHPKVSDRGRIPAEWLKEWEDAHPA